MFISMEGIDGAGKGTQAVLLLKAILARGQKAVLTREPGGTSLGRKLRQLLLSPEFPDETLEPMTELLLVLADRAQHVSKYIQPILAQGITVICDRYSDSTFAYQFWGRSAIHFSDLQDINHILNFPIPNLTFLLDLPVEIANARIKEKNHLETDLSFQHRARMGYLELANPYEKRMGAPFHQRIYTIDATLSIEEQHQYIISIYDKYIKEQ